MKEIFLTRVQAEMIKNDYDKIIIGNTYNVKGTDMKATGITLESIPDSEHWHVVVNFEILYRSFLPTSPIGLFLREAGIPFDLKKYVDIDGEEDITS